MDAIWLLCWPANNLPHDVSHGYMERTAGPIFGIVLYSGVPGLFVLHTLYSMFSF